MSDIRLLTTDDLAKILQLEPSTLIGWRKTGKGPSFTRLGKTVYYPAAVVTAWINEHLQAPARVARAPKPPIQQEQVLQSPRPERPIDDRMSVGDQLEELLA